MAKNNMPVAKVISLGFLCVWFLSFSTGGASAQAQTDPVTEAWNAYQEAGVRLDHASERVTAAKAAMNEPERRIKASVDRQKAADEAYKGLLDRYNQKRQELIQTFQQREDLLKLPRALFKEIEELDRRFKNLSRAGTSAVNIRKVNRARGAKRDELLRLREERKRRVEEEINPKLERLRTELKEMVQQLERGAVVQFDPVAILQGWANAVRALENAKEERSSAEIALQHAFDAYVEAAAKAGPPFLKKVTVNSDRPIEGTTTVYHFEWQAKKVSVPSLEHQLQAVRQTRSKERQARLRAAQQMVGPTQALNSEASSIAWVGYDRIVNQILTEAVTTYASIYLSGGVSAVGGEVKAAASELRAAATEAGLRKGWIKALREALASKRGQLGEIFKKGLRPEEVEAAGDVVGKFVNMLSNSSYAQPYDDLVTRKPKTTNWTTGIPISTNLETLKIGGHFQNSTLWPLLLIDPTGTVTASKGTDQTSFKNQLESDLKEWFVGDVAADTFIEIIQKSIKYKRIHIPGVFDIIDIPSLILTPITAAVKSAEESAFKYAMTAHQAKFHQLFARLQALYSVYKLSLKADEINAKIERDLVVKISKAKAINNGFVRNYVPIGGAESAKAIPASVKKLTVLLEFNRPINVAPKLRAADETIRLRGSGTNWSAEWKPQIKTRVREKVTLEISLDSHNKPFAQLDKDPQTTPYIELGKKSNGKVRWRGYEHGPDKRHVLRFDGYNLSGTWSIGKSKYDCVHTPEDHRFVCTILNESKSGLARGWRVGMVEYDLTIRGNQVSGKVGAAYNLDMQKKCPGYRGVSMTAIRNGKLELERLTISGWQFYSSTLDADKGCKITAHKWANNDTLTKDDPY